MLSLKNRFIVSLFAGFVVSLALFYLMSWLISGGKNMKPSTDSENFIEFVRLKRPSTLETKKRELPKKPEIKQQEIPKEKFNVAQDVKPSKPDLNFDTPKLDIPLAQGSGGMAIGSGGGGTSSTNSDETPLVRVEPQFPPEAALKGIDKGWVKVIFDLNADGSVTNARVVAASPRNVFESAAVKAILKWKYRPKVVDGKAVIRKDLKVQLDFGE